MMPERNSHWKRTFDHARRSRQWVQVSRFYTQATARQLASDIANAHTRPPHRHRVKGIRKGEVWETRWGIAPLGPNGDHVVWVRLSNPGRSSSLEP